MKSKVWKLIARCWWAQVRSFTWSSSVFLQRCFYWSGGGWYFTIIHNILCLLSDMLRVLVWEIWIWGDYGFFSELRYSLLLFMEFRLSDEIKKKKSEICVRCFCGFKHVCYEYLVYPCKYYWSFWFGLIESQLCFFFKNGCNETIIDIR